MSLKVTRPLGQRFKSQPRSNSRFLSGCSISSFGGDVVSASSGCPARSRSNNPVIVAILFDWKQFLRRGGVVVVWVREGFAVAEVDLNQKLFHVRRRRDFRPVISDDTQFFRCLDPVTRRISIVGHYRSQDVRCLYRQVLRLFTCGATRADTANPLGFHRVHQGIVGGLPNIVVEVAPFAPDLLLRQHALAEAREIGDQLAVVGKIYWSICDVAHWLTSDRAARRILTRRLSVFDTGQLCSQSRELRFE